MTPVDTLALTDHALDHDMALADDPVYTEWLEALFQDDMRRMDAENQPEPDDDRDSWQVIGIWGEIIR